MTLKSLIRETVDPKALKLGVSKMKNLASNCLLVECQNKKDSETLANELKKVNEVSVEQPKKKLPTLLLKYVPLSMADEEIKDTILHQQHQHKLLLR